MVTRRGPSEAGNEALPNRMRLIRLFPRSEAAKIRAHRRIANVCEEHRDSRKSPNRKCHCASHVC